MIERIFDGLNTGAALRVYAPFDELAHTGKRAHYLAGRAGRGHSCEQTELTLRLEQLPRSTGPLAAPEREAGLVRARVSFELAHEACSRSALTDAERVVRRSDVNLGRHVGSE